MSYLSISIKLLSYLTPTGADAPAPFGNLTDLFRVILDALRSVPNRPALLQEVYRLCFPGEPPDYGYLGKVAKAVGGAGRLAEMMWQLSARPPSGDIMAYILAGTRRNGHQKSGTVAGMNDEEWAEAMKTTRLALGVEEERKRA